MNADDRYDSMIAFYFEQEAARRSFDDSVDWHLVKAQVRQESNFNPEAVSPVGARGLMQIMPGTWGDNAFLRDAFNPEHNLRYGIAHLGYCWSIFKAERGLERWKFALGAFNAGQGHIIEAQRVLAAASRPTDLWIDIALTLPAITGVDNARETTEYVKRIVARFQEPRAERRTG